MTVRLRAECSDGGHLENGGEGEEEVEVMRARGSRRRFPARAWPIKSHVLLTEADVQNPKIYWAQAVLIYEA